MLIGAWPAPPKSPPKPAKAPAVPTESERTALRSSSSVLSTSFPSFPCPVRSALAQRHPVALQGLRDGGLGRRGLRLLAACLAFLTVETLAGGDAQGSLDVAHAVDDRLEDVVVGLHALLDGLRDVLDRELRLGRGLRRGCRLDRRSCFDSRSALGGGSLDRLPQLLDQLVAQRAHAGVEGGVQLVLRHFDLVLSVQHLAEPVQNRGSVLL